MIWYGGAFAQTSKLPAHTFDIMKNTEQRNIEKRIEQLEMDNNDLKTVWSIVERLTSENTDLKNRLHIVEEILSNWLPIVGEDKEWTRRY